MGIQTILEMGEKKKIVFLMISTKACTLFEIPESSDGYGRSHNKHKKIYDDILFFLKI